MDPCLYVVIQHVRGFPSLTSGSYCILTNAERETLPGVI